MLRKRFRQLAGEYELLVHGGTSQPPDDEADHLRYELDELADAINRLDHGSCEVCAVSASARGPGSF
jgi:hypothetical protein